MDTKRYKFKTRKGSTALTDEPFYTGAIKNERILTKKETYKELVKELGGYDVDLRDFLPEPIIDEFQRRVNELKGDK